ncbi:RNA polymerase II complex component [Heterostelium album PN500]|uniref:RNA polymerase II complex component n=1 Tax=Heterostelium pallidum (strain ATCC 26659 / Pp 5 / PN500) TaxID=670386 RepID=D3BLV6_HETP5|nr:RNA polymerase II complex component [Heterostelium album PN500]EFA77557.1 RNA polymerase II complex component [Heterostelium album PN500]|eukprot:XP_020429685.1 RNA polymerase II complex component [Heterostelium album PN500]
MSSYIYIPIKNSDKHVKVSTENLPHVQDVLQILKGEIAPLDIWLKISVEYYKQDMINEFIEILNQVLEPEVEKLYSDSKLGRIAMLNSLASYYTQAGSQERDKIRRDDYFNKATFHFNKAQKIDSHISLTWVGIAVLLLSRGDMEHAETHFLNVLNLASKDPQSIFLPVLPAQLGQGLLAEAEQIYLEVIQDSGFTLEDYKSVNITTTYNLGRLYESMNNFSRARDLYVGILGEHPNYLDCYMRIASVCRAEGNDFEAIEWIKEALNVDPNNAEAWSLYGSLHLSKEQWNFAQRKFEQIIDLSKTDPYASLALGNLYFQAKNQNPERYDKYLTLAETYYTKTLRNNPNNIYAANGLGMVAFEKGNLHLATEIFVQLREAAIDVQSVSLNLAHVYMEKKLFDFAIRLYEGCLKKCSDAKELELIYLYLSKALFEAQRYSECKQILKKAIHISPANMVLWFNLALTIEKYAAMFIHTAKKTLFDYSNLQKETAYARHLLMSISNSKNTKLGFDVKKCKTHLQSLDELQKKIGDEVKNLEIIELENSKKREIALQESIKKAEEREREEHERKAALQAKLEEEERLAAKQAKEFSDLLKSKEEEKSDDEQPVSSRKNKKNKDRNASDEEDEPREKRKDKKRKDKDRKEKKKDKERKKKKRKGKDGDEEQQEEDQEQQEQEEQDQEQEKEKEKEPQPEAEDEEYNNLFGSDEDEN